MVRPGRSLGAVAALFLAALLGSLLLKLPSLADAVAAEPLLGALQGLTSTLLAAFLVALVLAVLFATGARRLGRGRAKAGGLATIEGITAVLLVGLVLATAAGTAGTAFLSLGLVGVALTLALQRPILAVAGWAAVRFGRLFQEGDRIEVGGIVGDVVEIRLLSTRLWEIGSSGSPFAWGATVSPMRPTGRIVTVSNAMFLEQPLANASGDSPYIFDEFTVSVAYEADWRFAEEVLKGVAKETIDPRAHAAAAREYERLVEGLTLVKEFPREPVIHLSLEESWIDLRLRYLVDVRGRGAMRTNLARAWQEAIEPHADRLPNVYPRVQPMNVRADGRARD